MPNAGAYPIDVGSSVGQLRAILGDTSSVPLAPPVSGYADYAIWSDAVLLATLLATGDSIFRAAGTLYMSLAAEYIQQGRSIKTDDLGIDTRARGTDFLKVASSFFEQADGADATAASDFFQIVPFGGRSGANYAPEATPWPESEFEPVNTGGWDGGAP